MKTVTTLVKDIEDRIGDPFPPELTEPFGQKLARMIGERLGTRSSKTNLRLSNMGTPCARKLWYTVNTPELGEPLSPSARLKFLIGDIFEEVLLFLAKASGHKVEGEQDEVSVNGVRGHLDAIVDGHLLDVKSASPFAFDKFKQHELDKPGNDMFGYLVQLGSYAAATVSDPRVTDKSHASFLVGHKVLGKLCLDTHPVNTGEVDYAQMADDKRAMLAFPQPPKREFSDVPEGASGNRKLGIACSYCPFKTTCWPGLRAFAYSRGPMFLTVVAKVPNVSEISLEQAMTDD